MNCSYWLANLAPFCETPHQQQCRSFSQQMQCRQMPVGERMRWTNGGTMQGRMRHLAQSRRRVQTAGRVSKNCPLTFFGMVDLRRITIRNFLRIGMCCPILTVLVLHSGQTLIESLLIFFGAFDPVPQESRDLVIAFNPCSEQTRCGEHFLDGIDEAPHRVHEILEDDWLGILIHGLNSRLQCASAWSTRRAPYHRRSARSSHRRPRTH
jgi:hypothetical protein